MIAVHELFKTFRLSRRHKREMGSSFRGTSIDAVAGVSFECRPGRIFSLLGPNGAGKTTALRVIATMLRPTSGTVVVGGHDVTADPQAVRRMLGFLTGTTKLYDRLTPNELVRYYAELHGLSGANYRSRRDEVFARLDMEEYADRRIAKLSTGMKQKVSIARTIIHDPDILVFDEATAGLDVVASRGIVELIRSARDRGRTILYSTHRMGEVSLVCDDLAIIHRGRLLFNGTYDDFTGRMTASSLEDEFIQIIETAEAGE